MGDSALSALELRNLANVSAVLRDKAKARKAAGPERDLLRTRRSLREAEAEFEARRAEAIVVSGRFFI